MYNEIMKNLIKMMSKKSSLLYFSLSLLMVGSIVGTVLSYHFGAKDNESHEIVRKTGNELAKEIEREGMALVKNENHQLPLNKANKKINVFGRGSIDWRFGGSGSGGVGAPNMIDLVTALKDYGIDVNENLLNAYKAIKPHVDMIDTIGPDTERMKKSAMIYEPNISQYQDAYNEAKSFSDTAIVTISRYSGEGTDIAKQQYKNPDNREEAIIDSSRTTLEISTEEEDLLTQVGRDFNNVVVVVNCTTSFNLSFLDKIPGLKACLVVGATGGEGARAIPEILYGDYSPCGHLVDTYVYDFKSNPTYWHSGYENMGVYLNSNNEKLDCKGNSFGRGVGAVPYVDYVEGIYVGYKWYETADYEGYWNKAPYEGYDKVVQFPFGYGLTYTDFKWEFYDDESWSYHNNDEIKNNEKIKFKVKVTNIGNFPAKDIVEVYVTTPYYKGGIEKSYVSLVGFKKTPTLKPNESIILPFEIDTNNFRSYDCYDKNHNGFKGYEMEHGDYVLRLRSDAHHDKAMNGGNTLTFKVSKDIKITNDEVTNEPIRNLFTGEDAIDGICIDGSNASQNINYYSRANFPILPIEKEIDRTWTDKLEISNDGSESKKWNTYSINMANKWDNATGKDAFNHDIPTVKPAFDNGSYPILINNGALTDAGRRLAKDYHDSDWEILLNAIKYDDEAMKIIGENSCQGRAAMPTIGINQKTKDNDGPSQIRPGGAPYPSPTVSAMNFDEDMAYSLGLSYGKDMVDTNYDGAYGFGANIHRTPFCGRNFEYFSEDAYLTARYASNASKGVAVMGKTDFLKHFVANEQEQCRCGLYTWMSEQTLREIYVRPWEEAIKHGELTGIMTSFNRLGATWSSGSEAAIQGLLRNEWGYKGAIITDFGENTDYEDMAQNVRAGGCYGDFDTYQQSIFGKLPTYKESTPRFLMRLRNMCKECIYTFIHPLFVKENHQNVNDNIGYVILLNHPNEWWKPALITLDVLLGTTLIFLIIYDYKKIHKGLI